MKAWGALPVEPLTLSGAIKFSNGFERSAPIEVETGLEPATFRVAPVARIVVAAGRVDLALVADLVEAGGSVHEAKIALPQGFRLISVDADGLTDCVEEDRMLILRFDGPPLRARQVRLTGWTPLNLDPMNTTATTREVYVPWPLWPGQIELPGTLNIVAPTRFQLVDPNDQEISASEPSPTPPAASASAFRATYRNVDPEEPVRLRWEVEPPRVAVRLQSRLMIDNDRAEWFAVLRYEVSGGPLDAINLRLPTEWAKSASVRLVGVGHQQIKEVRDPYTFWTIRPEQPVWSSLRVIVRSTRALDPESSFLFPELSPLGRGAVDTYLRVVSQSGRKLRFENEQGLQLVAQSSLPVDEEFTATTLKAARPYCFRVVKPGWSLLVAGVNQDEPNRVIRAEATTTVDGKGQAFGLATFKIGPNAGAFLSLAFDGAGEAEVQPLYAAVNGNATKFFRNGSDHWLIPLVEQSSTRMSLAWTSTSASSAGANHDTGAALPLALPTLGTGKIPMVVSVRTPAEATVLSPPGRLYPVNSARLDLELARRISRQTAEALTSFDRSSRKDGEDLVSAIVRFELRIREAERASAWDPAATSSARRQTLNQTRVVARELRERFRDALNQAGLNGFENAARVQLGLANSGTGSSYAPTLEPSLAVRVPPIGVSHEFLGELQVGRGGPWLFWTRPLPSNGTALSILFGGLLLTALMTAFAFALARRERLARSTGLMALSTGLGLTLVFGGLWWLAGAAGLSVVGRWDQTIEV